MEVQDENMGIVVERIHQLPAGVPNDAEPVTDEQLERLPDYVQSMIQEFMNGAITPSTSREELERVRAAFFAAAPRAIEAPREEGAAAAAPTSNSMICEEGVDEESMRID